MSASGSAGAQRVVRASLTAM
eukprot:COSAG02_NODE_14235_length_1295_cov_1.156355_3_plen_20_part_01